MPSGTANQAPQRSARDPSAGSTAAGWVERALFFVTAKASIERGRIPLPIGRASRASPYHAAVAVSQKGLAQFARFRRYTGRSHTRRCWAPHSLGLPGDPLEQSHQLTAVRMLLRIGS